MSTAQATVALLTGGPDYAHDFRDTGGAFRQLAVDAAFAVRSVDHPSEVTPDLLDGCSALLVNALWWRMLGDAYDEWRAEWSYETTPALRSAISEFVAGGGGLLANHTAPICFDDWPEWATIVGGGWRWGSSSHPPLGPVTAHVCRDHPVTADIANQFDLVDEVYGDLALQPGIEVLATARRTPDDADQPVVWAHRFGRGRTVFAGFGHHPATIHDPSYHRLLTQALRWVCDSSNPT